LITLSEIQASKRVGKNKVLVEKNIGR